LFFRLLSDLPVVSTLNNQGLKDHIQFSVAMPVKENWAINTPTLKVVYLNAVEPQSWWH
jgi:hypothetical protein